MVEKLVRRVVDTLPVEEQEAHDKRVAGARQVRLPSLSAQSGRPQSAAAGAAPASGATAYRSSASSRGLPRYGFRGTASQPEATASGSSSRSVGGWCATMSVSSRTKCRTCNRSLARGTPLFQHTSFQRRSPSVAVRGRACAFL